MKVIKYYGGRPLTHLYKSFMLAIFLRINVQIAKDSQKMQQRNSFWDKTFPLGTKTSNPVSKLAAAVTCTVTWGLANAFIHSLVPALFIPGLSVNSFGGLREPSRLNVTQCGMSLELFWVVTEMTSTSNMFNTSLWVMRKSLGSAGLAKALLHTQGSLHCSSEVCFSHSCLDSYTEATPPTALLWAMKTSQQVLDQPHKETCGSGTRQLIKTTPPWSKHTYPLWICDARVQAKQGHGGRRGGRRWVTWRKWHRNLQEHM